MPPAPLIPPYMVLGDKPPLAVALGVHERSVKLATTVTPLGPPITRPPRLNDGSRPSKSRAVSVLAPFVTFTRALLGWVVAG